MGHEPEPDEPVAVLTLTCFSMGILATLASKSVSRVRANSVVLTGFRFAWMKHCNIHM